MILTHAGSHLAHQGALLIPPNNHIATDVLVGYASSDASDDMNLRREINGTWMGRESWDDLAAGHWLNAPENVFKQWMTIAGNSDKAADVGTPLIPHNSGPGGEHTSSGRAVWPTLLDEGSSGARDTTYTSMGESLATLGPDTVYARVWWEMNQYPGSVDAAKFKACWDRAIPLIRAGFATTARAGQTLSIVYCPMASGTSRWTYLPDLANVDVIGLDLYAGLWGTTISDETAVLTYTQSMLDELTTKGAEIGKPLCLGEWGNWAEGTPGVEGTHGVGDFPDFIDQVCDWADVEDVTYLVYFNIASGGVGMTLDDTPLSLARLRARYGPAS